MGALRSSTKSWFISFTQNKSVVWWIWRQAAQYLQRQLWKTELATWAWPIVIQRMFVWWKTDFWTLIEQGMQMTGSPCHFTIATIQQCVCRPCGWRGRCGWFGRSTDRTTNRTTTWSWSPRWWTWSVWKRASIYQPKAQTQAQTREKRKNEEGAEEDSKSEEDPEPEEDQEMEGEEGENGGEDDDVWDPLDDWWLIRPSLLSSCFGLIWISCFGWVFARTFCVPLKQNALQTGTCYFGYTFSFSNCLNFLI